MMSPIIRIVMAACALACSGCVSQQLDFRTANRMAKPPKVKHTVVLTMPRECQDKFVPGDELKGWMENAFTMGSADAGWLRRTRDGTVYPKNTTALLSDKWTVEETTRDKVFVWGNVLMVHTPGSGLGPSRASAKPQVLENVDVRAEVRFYE